MLSNANEMNRSITTIHRGFLYAQQTTSSKSLLTSPTLLTAAAVERLASGYSIKRHQQQGSCPTAQCLFHPIMLRASG